MFSTSMLDLYILTLDKVLDFGAARDGVPREKLGRRIVVDAQGMEIPDGLIRET